MRGSSNTRKHGGGAEIASAFLAFLPNSKNIRPRAIFLLPTPNRFPILVFVAMEIMNSSLSGSRNKFLLVCAALSAPTMAFAADIVLQKAPPLTVEQAPAYPENVARYHFGAAVQALPQGNGSAKLELSSNGEDRNISVAALLCDDPTIGYQLPAGKSSILVSLANIENVATVSLLNEGAKGNLAIAVSNADVPNDSPEWHNLDSRLMTNGAMTAKVGPGEAKYIRLTFDISEPGRIAAFGVYATPAVSDFTMPRPRKVSFASESPSFSLINYNFTDLHIRARALYASSGDLKQANKMLDGQPGSTYDFAAGDSAPTAVIDLGRERTLSRISALYSAQAGSVDFYVLNKLPINPATDANQSALQKISNEPQTADLPGNIKVSDATLASIKPVGSVVSTDQGRAAVDFAPTNGRYIMLKWHPATVQGQTFSVAQVAAFGRSLNGQTASNAGRDRMMGESDVTSADGKSILDGKDIVDGKSILDDKDIPAEGPGAEAQPPGEGPPPALPEVPPFTFIPQVTPQVPPTSP